MANPGKDTPAIFRRAFFMVMVLATGLRAAQPSAPPELAQVGKPSPEQVRELITKFRDSGIAGEYYFEFDLIQLPRRGEEKVFHGKLWGGRNEQGAITRISLTTDDGREQRLLVQNGPKAAVWRFTGGQVAMLGVAALFEPIVPGVELTAFDLQMPFLYWPDATVESIKRIAGRPTHEFVFSPPAAFAAQHPELRSVRSYFDTQFNKPMQTELVGRDGRVTKTWSLVDLKTIDGQTIPKTFDVRDEVSRNKTRLNITGAALDLKLPATIFAPAELAGELRPPPPERIVRLAP